jgi:ankyrin repeat protein
MINALMQGAVFLTHEQDRRGSTALHDACRHNQVELVKEMLSNQITNVNHQDNNGCTPFHICIQRQRRNTKIYEIFLNNEKVDFSLEDNNGHTTFDSYFTTISDGSIRFLSELNNLKKILAKLVQKVSPIMLNTDKRKYNLIHTHVCKYWFDFDAFDFLLNNDDTAYMINQQDRLGNTPFHYSCSRPYGHNTDHYKRLIQQPSLLLNKRNDKGRTPFHSACYVMNPDIISDLIKNGVNTELIDKQGENALHHIIQRLINRFCDYSLFLEVIQILLTENPYLVNQKNNSNETPIDYAIKWDNIHPDETSTLMNNKPRRLYGPYCKEFWSSLLGVLKQYQLLTRNHMYEYFMKNY